MICRADVIGEARGKALDGEKNLERQRIARAVELADVKLRHDVVNIENDFGAAELREQRSEDLEIRNGMDVNEVVFLFQVALGQKGHGAQKELNQAPDVGEFAFLVDLAGLDAMDADT